MQLLFHRGCFRVTLAGIACGTIVLLVVEFGPLTHGAGSGQRALSQEPGQPKTPAVGAYTFNPTIAVGNAKSTADFTGPDTPNKPGVHQIDLTDKLPRGSRIVAAWYTPQHNIPAVLKVALIDVMLVPAAKQSIALALAGFKNTPADGRIKIHVLYIQE
jgi:hypothetical protein